MYREHTRYKCIECEKELPEPYIERPIFIGTAFKGWEKVGTMRCPRCLEAREIRSIGEAFEAVGSALNSWHPDLGGKYDNRPDVSEAYRKCVAALGRLRKIASKDLVATLLAKTKHEQMTSADSAEELKK